MSVAFILKMLKSKLVFWFHFLFLLIRFSLLLVSVLPSTIWFLFYLHKSFSLILNLTLAHHSQQSSYLFLNDGQLSLLKELHSSSNLLISGRLTFLKLILISFLNIHFNEFNFQLFTLIIKCWLLIFLFDHFLGYLQYNMIDFEQKIIIVDTFLLTNFFVLFTCSKA